MTTSSPTLLDLAARVEKLTGPCRETDALLALVAGCTEISYRVYRGPDGKYLGSAPYYTRSLDAAMTLMPDGYASAVGTMAFAGTDRTPWATYWTPQGEPHTFEAATPALALVTASLRARSALEASHD